jgi:hypothetical protein
LEIYAKECHIITFRAAIFWGFCPAIRVANESLRKEGKSKLFHVKLSDLDIKDAFNVYTIQDFGD